MASLFIFYVLSFGILFILMDLGLYFARKRYNLSDYTKLLWGTITKAIGGLEQHWYSVKQFLRSHAIHQKKGLKDGNASQSIVRYDRNSEALPGTDNQQNDIWVDISANPSSNDLINKAQKKMVHFDLSADIPDGTSINVVLHAKGGIGTAEIKQTGDISFIGSTGRSIPEIFLNFLRNLQQWISHKVNSWNPNPTTLDKYLLTASILIYALIIGIGIDRYPIFFFY